MAGDIAVIALCAVMIILLVTSYVSRNRSYRMERIMELPFDIIKFDRSLVIASGTDERSEKIVENLAHMFREMGYSVLYEGIESDVDEKRCRDMSASYLQGFKYSRPVPIEEIREYLTRTS